MKTDLSIIHKFGKKAVVLSLSGTFCPFSLVMLVALFICHYLPDNYRNSRYVAYLSTCWAITSNTVLSCLLDEFHLLTSMLGRLAPSASLLADFLSVILSSASFAVSVIINLQSASFSMFSLAFTMFLVFIVLIVRLLMLWLI